MPPWGCSLDTTELGVPVGQSTQIMGDNFKPGQKSEVVTFLTQLAFQPLPLYKSNREKGKIGGIAFYFCIMPSDWPNSLYSSIQVKPYDVTSYWVSFSTIEYNLL